MQELRKIRKTRGARTALILGFLIWLPFGCTPAKDGSVSASGKADSEELLSQLQQHTDENGTPIAKEGLRVDSSLEEDGNRIDQDTLLAPDQASKKLFEYEPPAGVTAEFSEPVMVTAAFLTATPLEEVCANLQYDSVEPTLGQVLEGARQRELCGHIEFSYCFKLTMASASQIVYLKSPSFRLHLSCASETLAHVGLSIDEGAAATKNSEVSLDFTTGPLVSQVYVTNTAGCQEGGTWQDVSSPMPWTLAQQNVQNTVYATFRDVLGRQSACLSANITHDNDVSGDESLVIEAGTHYTQSQTVSIGLTASDAFEVYLTNTAGCESGGTWEGLASSINWTLEQTEANASVYAKFRDTLGNTSSCVSDSITHDSIAPTEASVAIAGGATQTNTTAVTLSLAANDASSIYVTNTADCANGGMWEPYATSKAWTLGQTAGTATVYVAFMDAAGNSTCVSDTITQDAMASSVSIDAGASYTNSASVSLSLAATGASTIYVTNTPGCSGGGSWEAYATSKAWTLAQSEGTATVYVGFRDASGQSICVSDTIIHDTIAPTTVAVSIAGGAAYASSTDVTLTLAATGASSMYITNTAGCGSGGSWESYAMSKPWTLGQTEGTATVYVAFKDAAGNSTCVSDTITHDATAPTASSVSIDAGATYATSTSVTLTLAATGASTMYVTNTAGCGSGGSWETYGTSKAWTLGQTEGASTVYVAFKDAADNSTCVSDTITHDATAPTSASVSVDAGASYTTSTNVTLTLYASGASSMYVTNTAGCSSGGSWESYGTSKAWALGQTEGTATVYVAYRDTAGNSTCVSDTITHDTTAPTSTSVSIDAGATYATSTSVTLTLAATGASSMYVTNTAGCGSGGSWENYATSKAWTLGQTEGTATVYVAFKDAAGNSTCVSDTITHDATAPTASSVSIDAGATYATSTSVTLTLAATGASTMYVTNTAGCGSGGSWETYGTSKAWTLGQTEGTATVYVAFKDAAGNSSCVSDTITHDATAPTAASVSIDAGATYATSTNVTLTLAATGASTMYVTNTAGCGSGGSWESYGTSKAWALGQTEGTATVYVAYRDTAGNSTCVSDTIIHDSVAPSGGTISVSSGATYTTSTSVSLSLSASGAADMYITNTAGCGSGGTWETYATTKAGWVLGASNATTTVYVWFKDSAGNVGSCESDAIIHDSTDPTAPGSFSDGVNTSSASTSPTMSWSASTDSGSGMSHYQIAVGTTAGDTDVLTWTNVGNVTSASVSGLSLVIGNTYYGSVRAVDAAGRTSSVSAGDGFTHSIQWSQQAYIKAYNNSASDSLGENLSLYGDTLAAVSDLEDSGQTTITNGTTAATDNAQSESGAVYIYKRTGTTWAQEAYIKAVNANANDGPRATVSLYNDTLAVGVKNEDSNETTISNDTTASTDDSATDAGAAYIYVRSAGAWSQQAYIKPANAGSGDNFGWKVSLYGDTLAVTANAEDSNASTITNGTGASADNSSSNAGAVYVYKRTAASWTQEAYIKASNSDSTDAFGESVTLWSDTLAVGAVSEDSNVTTITNDSTASTNNSQSASGAVYVYQRSGTEWTQQAYLKAANALAGDQFGSDVALYMDTLAVAAKFQDGSETTIINATTVGAVSSPVSDTGAVYVYQRTGTTWAMQSYIKAANADASDQFGHKLSLYSNTLVVGVELENSNQTTITNGSTASANNSAADAGATYVYQRTGATWAQQAYLKSGNARSNDWFGYRVSIYGDTIAVAADGEDSNVTTITNGTGVSTDTSNADAGAIYIYTR